MGIKQKLLNIRIKNEEKKFLEREKNQEFKFFGYIGAGIDEMPVFITKGQSSKTQSGKSVDFANIVYVFTPQTLKLCVCNLTDEAKSDLAQDIDEFKRMCNEIAAESVYQAESWEEQIEALATYLEPYNQNQNE